MNNKISREQKDTDGPEYSFLGEFWCWTGAVLVLVVLCGAVTVPGVYIYAFINQGAWVGTCPPELKNRAVWQDWVLGGQEDNARVIAWLKSWTPSSKPDPVQRPVPGRRRPFDVPYCSHRQAFSRCRDFFTLELPDADPLTGLGQFPWEPPEDRDRQIAVLLDECTGHWRMSRNERSDPRFPAPGKSWLEVTARDLPTRRSGGKSPDPDRLAVAPQPVPPGAF